MPFAKINGTRGYYEIHGNGDTLETLVLLNHGFGSTTMWRHIYPRLVEKRYRVVMY